MFAMKRSGSRRNVMARTLALSLSVTLLVTGCTADDGATGSGRGPSPSVSGAPGDPGSATSTQESTSAAAQGESSRAQELQGITAYFANMVDCLNEAGYRMRLTPGQLGYEADPAAPSSGSQEAFIAAQAACDKTYGPPPAPAPFTAQEWAAAYPAQVAVVDCLKQNGYPVPEVPTSDAWVQQQVAPPAGVRPWSPYDKVSGPELTEAQQQCPAKDVLEVLAESGS